MALTPRQRNSLLWAYRGANVGGANLGSSIAAQTAASPRVASLAKGLKQKEEERATLLAGAIKTGQLKPGQLTQSDLSLVGPKLKAPNKPTSFNGGFLSDIGDLMGNLGQDIWEAGKGIPGGLKETLGAIGEDVLRTFNPGMSMGGPAGVQAPKNKSQIKEKIVDPTVAGYAYTYLGKGAPEGSTLKGRIAEHPLGPLLDAATVASLGTGGAIRGAQIASGAGRGGAFTDRLARLGSTEGRPNLVLNPGQQDRAGVFWPEIEQRYSSRPLMKAVQKTWDFAASKSDRLNEFGTNRATKRLQRMSHATGVSAEAAAVRAAVKPLVGSRKDLSFEESVALDYALRGWNTPEKVAASKQMFQDAYDGNMPEGANMDDFSGLFKTPDDAREFTLFKANLPHAIEQLIYKPTDAMINASHATREANEEGFFKLGVEDPDDIARRVNESQQILSDYMMKKGQPPTDPPDAGPIPVEPLPGGGDPFSGIDGLDPEQVPPNVREAYERAQRDGDEEASDSILASELFRQQNGGQIPEIDEAAFAERLDTAERMGNGKGPHGLPNREGIILGLDRDYREQYGEPTNEWFEQDGGDHSFDAAVDAISRMYDGKVNDDALAKAYDDTFGPDIGGYTSWAQYFRTLIMAYDQALKGMRGNVDEIPTLPEAPDVIPNEFDTPPAYDPDKAFDDKNRAIDDVDGEAPDQGFWVARARDEQAMEQFGLPWEELNRDQKVEVDANIVGIPEDMQTSWMTDRWPEITDREDGGVDVSYPWRWQNDPEIEDPETFDPRPSNFDELTPIGDVPDFTPEGPTNVIENLAMQYDHPTDFIRAANEEVDNNPVADEVGLVDNGEGGFGFPDDPFTRAIRETLREHNPDEWNKYDDLSDFFFLIGDEIATKMDELGGIYDGDWNDFKAEILRRGDELVAKHGSIHDHPERLPDAGMPDPNNVVNEGFSPGFQDQLNDIADGVDDELPPNDPPNEPPPTAFEFGAPENYPIQPTYVPNIPAAGFQAQHPSAIMRATAMGADLPETTFGRGKRDRQVNATGVTASNLFAQPNTSFLRERPEVLMSGAARIDPKAFVESVARREKDMVQQGFNMDILNKLAAKDDVGEPQRFNNQEEVQKALGPDWVLVNEQFPLQWFQAESNVLEQTVQRVEELRQQGVPLENPEVESLLNELADVHAQEFVKKAFGAQKLDGVAIPRTFFNYQRRLITATDPFDNPAGRIYSRYMHRWRALTLAYMPRWALNTAIGSFALNMLKGVTPRDYMVARRLHKQGVFGEPRLGGVELGAITGLEYLEPALLGRSERATGVGITPLGERIVEGVQRIEDHFRRASFIHSLDKVTQRRMQTMGQVLSNLERRRYSIYDKYAMHSRTDDDVLEAALDDPEIVQESIDDLNTFAYNYAALGPYERRYVRMAIPFWGWYKFISKVAYRLPLEDPGRANILANIGMLGAGYEDEALGDRPDWLTGVLPLGENEQGALKYMSTMGWNPFSSIINPLSEQGAIEGALGLGQASPPIQALLSAYGLDTMRGGNVPISPEQGVGTDYFGALWDLENGKETNAAQQAGLRRLAMGLLRSAPQFRMGEQKLAGGRPVYPESIPFFAERPMPADPKDQSMLALLGSVLGIAPKTYDLKGYKKGAKKRLKYARTRNKTAKKRLKKELK
jgi:hypothetical protein